VKHHGIRGLYSGVGAVCAAVGPEKAISLTANDYCRQFFADENGVIPIGLQAVSGAFSGFCQTLFTNPQEIVKIRLQLNPNTTITNTVRELGVLGLYKGRVLTKINPRLSWSIITPILSLGNSFPSRLQLYFSH